MLRRFTPVCTLMLVCLVVPAAFAQSASPASDAKIHAALLRRLALEGDRAKGWVFFTDKGYAAPGAEAAAIERLAATYNARAVQRRLLRGSAAARAGYPCDASDLPVDADYVAAVTAGGATLEVTSRWLNAVAVRGSTAQFQTIAALPYVRAIQPVARGPRRDAWKRDSALPPPIETDRGYDYGYAREQLEQIRLPQVHDAGFTADGVIIGVLDTGFERAHEAFHQPGHELDVLAEWDFLNNDPNTGYQNGDPWDQHYHGTLILGTIGAYYPGKLIGGAFDAQFVLCKTEDVTGEYPQEEHYYVAGLEFIESHGGDLATSSLGYIDWYTQRDLDGQTAVTTKAVNIATAKGMHCCTAAGNEGHDNNPATSHLIAPADAFQVITCGAVSREGSIAGFSSDGPTADGRVKPEALARGEDTMTVDPFSTTGYTGASGTSLSTPLVACVVACLTQAHPDWTVDELRTALFHTADDYQANGTYDAKYVRGYGILNAALARPDCNGNRVPDVLDIQEGTSLDNNGNGIPDECETLKGDLNCDGQVDFGDIAPFVLLLSDPAAYASQFPNCPTENGDMNNDGVVNFGDINPFVELLT